MLCWRFTIYNTLSTICGVEGISCCVAMFTIHNALSTYVVCKSLLDHRNVGCTYTLWYIKLNNSYGLNRLGSIR